MVHYIIVKWVQGVDKKHLAEKASTHIELSQVLIERLCRKCSTQPFFLHNTA